jgi:hypothetical protein
LLQEVLLTPLLSPVPAPTGCNDDGFEELNVNGPDHANAMTILQYSRAPAGFKRKKKEWDGGHSWGQALSDSFCVWLFAEKNEKKKKKCRCVFVFVMLALFECRCLRSCLLCWPCLNVAVCVRVCYVGLV